jgi:hypothetical protein
MSKSNFDEFVNRQQTKQQDDEAAFDPKEQLKEWLDHLDVLYKKMTEFLELYIQNGSAQIEYQEIQINEEFIGLYTARKMLLKIGCSTVTFTPVGTMIIGTKGRVDVQGSLGSARLNLINKQVTSARQLVQVRVVRSGEQRPAPPSSEAVKNIEWAWKISTPPPEMKFIELTQEAFFDMVLSIADA